MRKLKLGRQTVTALTEEKAGRAGGGYQGQQCAFGRPSLGCTWACTGGTSAPGINGGGNDEGGE